VAVKSSAKAAKRSPAKPRAASSAGRRATRSAQPEAPAQHEGARVRTFNRRLLKASESLAHELLLDIIRRDLKPGDRLPRESEMIASFEVSRATVREALRILEINGLVSMRTGPNGGPSVRQPSPSDFGRALSLFLQAERITLQEILEARCLLEPAIARDATVRQEPAFIARVEDLMSRGRTVDIDDDEAYVRLTREFHELMASSASNRVFTLFGLGLLSMFVGTMERAIFPPGERRAVILEHERILQAILKRQADRAEKLMRVHMDHFLDGIARRQPDTYRKLIRWI
jgi:GntR family transcriptional repressor for pyruvate dehydrogenase complex